MQSGFRCKTRSLNSVVDEQRSQQIRKWAFFLVVTTYKNSLCFALKFRNTGVTE